MNKEKKMQLNLFNLSNEMLNKNFISSNVKNPEELGIFFKKKTSRSELIKDFEKKKLKTNPSNDD